MIQIDQNMYLIIYHHSQRNTHIFSRLFEFFLFFFFFFFYSFGNQTYEERNTEPGTIRKLKNKRKRQVELSLSQLSTHLHPEELPKKLESPGPYSIQISTCKIINFL